MGAGARCRFAGLALAAAAGAGVVLLAALPGPAAAGPADDCLADGGDPKAAVAACEQAGRMLGFVRDSKRSNPGGDPRMPPALRTSRFPLAELAAARGRHQLRAGNPSGARSALAEAERINPGAPGVASLRAAIERGGGAVAAAPEPAPPATAAPRPASPDPGAVERAEAEQRRVAEEARQEREQQQQQAEAARRAAEEQSRRAEAEAKATEERRRAEAEAEAEARRLAERERMVRDMQEDLAALGLLRSADGDYGESTKRALGELVRQGRLKLKVPAEPDAALVAAVGRLADAKRAEEKAAAELAGRAEKGLYELGLLAGAANGRLDPAEVEALDAFRRANGLGGDAGGPPDAASVAALEKAGGERRRQIAEAKRLEAERQAALVLRAQAALAALGREVGKPDGRLGTRTRRALEAEGVRPDGDRLDEAAVAALEVRAAGAAEVRRLAEERARADEERRVAEAARRRFVADVQARMAELGAVGLPADGTLDAATVEAVRRFRARYGLAAAGDEPDEALAAALDREIEAAREEERRLAEALQRDLVRRAQVALRDLDHPLGEPDGSLGEATREALSDEGVVVGRDGLGEAQVAELERRAEAGRRALVAEVQRRLASLGVSGLPGDGTLDPSTREAISGFQARSGLRVDGMPGRPLVAALDKALAAQREERQASRERRALELLAALGRGGAAAGSAGGRLSRQARAALRELGVSPKGEVDDEAVARLEGLVAEREAAARRLLVADAQKWLTWLGVDGLRTDGEADGATEEAVRAYQARAGVEPDGRVDRALVVRLAADAVAHQAALLRRSQLALAELELGPGPADGTLNPPTRRALRDAGVALPEDGHLAEAQVATLETRAARAVEERRLVAEAARRRLVARVQEALAGLGEAAGLPGDGTLDPATAAAIRAAQARAGLPADGEPSERLAAMLEDRLLAKLTAERAERVRLAELALRALGHEVGPADGVADERTARALADFARLGGDPPPAEVDDRLVARLRAAADDHLRRRRELAAARSASEVAAVKADLESRKLAEEARRVLAAAVSACLERRDAARCEEALASPAVDPAVRVELLLARAPLLAAAGAADRARADLHAARELAAGDARPLVGLGDLALAEGGLDGAEALYRRAREVDPGSAAAERGVAVVEERKAALRRLVARAQEGLAELGLHPGRRDGVADEATVAAWGRFALARGLAPPAPGQAMTEADVAAVEGAVAETRAARDRERLLLAQARGYLAELGRPLAGDEATREALRAFREERGLPSGTADEAVVAALAQAVEERRAELARLEQERQAAELRAAAEREALAAEVKGCTAWSPAACERALGRESLTGEGRAVVLRYHALIVANTGARDLGRALAHLAEAERLAPSDTEVAVAQGQLLARAERLEEAAAAYRRALALDPARTRLERTLAEVEGRIEERRRVEEARQLAEAKALRQRIVELQEGLRRLGRLFEPADGVLTDTTASELLGYQGEKGIAGEITGEAMLDAIRRDVAALEEAERQRLAQDTTPPEIESEAEVAYEDERRGALLTGRVRDAGSGGVTLTLAGEPVDVAPDGSFSRLVYVRRDQRLELELVALDRAGNEARRKVVASRGFDVGAQVVELPPLDPGKARGAPNPDAVAVVIGIGRYENLPDAKYAADDAGAFVDYAQYALGVPPDRVLYLVDERARTLDLLERVDEHLGRFAREGRSDVYVFFSGHGFAEDGAPLLLAHDFRKSAAARTSIGQKELLDRVGEFRPRSATLFVDACFSGYSRSNELLVADARLLSVEVDLAAGAGAAAVLASSGPDDISVAIETNKVRNGAFSYMLMRGLEGAADEDGDGAITVGELFGFVRAEVPRHAQTPGGRQVPWYNGADADRVLVRLR